ncbi:MAG TPA: HNH endonuclease signature motif containing protein [Propionicimonas sp.]
MACTSTVLGGPSTVLDVGRDHRLVPPDLRAALVLRDGGCVFPGCHARASECEAHHISPWWQGGVTALSNLALLCHHHHGLVEPARYSVRDQWQIRIAADGIPETIPPQRCDPQRQPRRHARHQKGQDPGASPPLTAGLMDEFELTG